jgi:SNF2 family DNA or RNA helicase
MVSTEVEPLSGLLLSLLRLQWTGMLDLLEVPLRKAGFGFRRLDGTMTVAARERAIADFESSCDVMALIVVSCG